MATFLELAKDVARESGSVDPGAITSVVGLTGRPAKIVNWVNRAWLNIQNSRRDWGWLFAAWTQILIPGSSVYTPASFNLTRFSSWCRDRCGFMPVTIFDQDIGVSDENAIPYISYEEWLTKWNRGDQSNFQRPVEYSISPRNEIVFGPIPDKPYVVSGQYQRGPQTLETDADIPEMPARFHDIITAEAIRLMLLSDGDYQESQFPTMEMVGLRHELELDQLPEISI